MSAGGPLDGPATRAGSPTSMFAKRAPNPVPVAAPASASRSFAQQIFANPALSAGGAGLFFVLAAMATIVVAGDPSAGAPSVRIPLTQPGAPPPPPGWREARVPDQNGAPPVTTDSLQLLAANAADDAPIQGQAIISFPGGSSDGGGLDNSGQALPPAPLNGLSAPGPGGGALPVIAPDGRTPAQAYARPFQSNGKPKIALVIGGLGLNAKGTREAIEQLPPEVTLSFVPYTEGLQGWIDLARASGHEVLLEAPMEPNDYPDNDPGPYTLMAAGKPAETTQRLDWLLSRAVGYFGVTNYLGSKFVTSDAGMGAFMADLRARGLAFVDDGSAARRNGDLPRASADRVIDDQLAGDAIDKQLLALEASALQNGQSLGAGFAYPITLAQVRTWAAGLAQRGYQLAPASALTVKR
jgi:polysaccharide deacetylase 2 family uncharacterized protein YibQ